MRMAIVEIKTGRDYHQETVAFLKSMDIDRKRLGLHVILHNWKKYRQGWLRDTETGRKWFCLAPLPGSVEYLALEDSWHGAT